VYRALPSPGEGKRELVGVRLSGYNPRHRAHRLQAHGCSVRGYTVMGIMDELPQASPAGVVIPPGTLPSLENGDRLTRSDFEQRYEAMPHVKKAELIEGIVYMPSPVRVRSHGNAGPQPLSEAGARHERTLEAVGCRPWFGWRAPTPHRCRGCAPLCPVSQPLAVLLRSSIGSPHPPGRGASGGS
jgi:hypothetical protein